MISDLALKEVEKNLKEKRMLSIFVEDYLFSIHTSRDDEYLIEDYNFPNKYPDLKLDLSLVYKKHSVCDDDECVDLLVILRLNSNICWYENGDLSTNIYTLNTSKVFRKKRDEIFVFDKKQITCILLMYLKKRIENLFCYSKLYDSLVSNNDEECEDEISEAINWVKNTPKKECCVCLEEVHKNNELECGHYVCRICTNTMASHHKFKCPMCRKCYCGNRMICDECEDD